MILGIPILDIAWVMINRIRRGQHPMRRDILPLYARFTHLHYRLLFGGLNTKQICFLLYGVTFILGTLTLVLPSDLKLIGLLLMGGLMILLLRWSVYLQNRKLDTDKLQKSL
jgi:UDP-GlcNAc:undecaprenyl-phosphate GlcNAc-1-phosphate transferase